MKYAFEFSVLTIGDYVALMRASEKGDAPKFIEVLARTVAVDVYSLPLTEAQPLMNQFAAAFRAYVEQAKAAQDDAELPEAMRLLRRMFGDE